MRHARARRIVTAGVWKSLPARTDTQTCQPCPHLNSSRGAVDLASRAPPYRTPLAPPPLVALTFPPSVCPFSSPSHPPSAGPPASAAPPAPPRSLSPSLTPPSSPFYPDRPEPLGPAPTLSSPCRPPTSPPTPINRPLPAHSSSPTPTPPWATPPPAGPFRPPSDNLADRATERPIGSIGLPTAPTIATIPDGPTVSTERTPATPPSYFPTRPQGDGASRSEANERRGGGAPGPARPPPTRPRPRCLRRPRRRKPRLQRRPRRCRRLGSRLNPTDPQSVPGCPEATGGLCGPKGSKQSLACCKAIRLASVPPHPCFSATLAEGPRCPRTTEPAHSRPPLPTPPPAPCSLDTTGDNEILTTYTSRTDERSKCQCEGCRDPVDRKKHKAHRVRKCSCRGTRERATADRPCPRQSSSLLTALDRWVCQALQRQQQTPRLEVAANTLC